MVKSKNLILLIVFATLALLTTVFWAMAIRLPAAYSLVQNGQSAMGTVVSLERENHRSVRFQYQVDGQSFTSLGSAENIGRTFELMQIGETVPITYDATDHGSAVMGPPERFLYDGLRGIGFAFIGLTVSFLLYLWKRRVSKSIV